MARRKKNFEAGQYYHLYNRGHNRGRIFFEERNYRFYLRRVRRYLAPVLDVVAYCLMPTHYHLLVGVKDATGKTGRVEEPAPTGSTAAVIGSVDVSHALRRLHISYTKAINKEHDRVGSLFQGSYQAKHVSDNAYLAQLSRYIHRNPLDAGLVNTCQDWPWSSYPDYVKVRGGTLPRPEVVLSQFDSIADYRAFVETELDDDPEAWRTVLFDR